jgi:hypothetical protein
VRCTAIRWVNDDPQPGWVEVRMTDAFGREWIFFDNPVIFGGGAELSSRTTYPVPVTIRCEIIANDMAGAELAVRISTARPDGVSAVGDVTAFDVRPDQLVLHDSDLDP